MSLRGDSQVPHQERIDIRGLLDRFGCAAGSVSRLRVNADQNGIITGLRGLERGSVLEGVRGEHAIIVVGRCNQGRRITCAVFDVMFRRVSLMVLELFWIITVAVVSNSVRADREFVEAQHVHYACLLHNGLVQFRPLIRHRAHQQSTV